MPGKALIEKEEHIYNLETKFENVLEKELNSKMKKMEDKFAEVIKQKDTDIENLENKLKQLENKFAEINLEKLKKPVNEELKCSKCDFTSLSKQGLKTHTKRKHTVADAEKYPRTCDMCEFELQNFKQMKLHMKSHSYKQTSFKCENCDVWGPNNYTMDIHFGRNHSDIF